MCKRFVSLESPMKDLAQLGNKAVDLHERYWEQVKDMVNILEGPYKLTKLLQRDNLTAGRFFFEWIKLKESFGDEDSSIISDRIRESMEVYEKDLFTPILMAAIVIDQNYYRLLNEDELKEAKETILKLILRIEDNDLSDIPSRQTPVVAPLIDPFPWDDENLETAAPVASTSRARAAGIESSSTDDDVIEKLRRRRSSGGAAAQIQQVGF